MNEMREREIVNIAYDKRYEDASVAEKSKAKQILALLPMKEEVKEEKLAFIHANDVRIKELEEVLKSKHEWVEHYKAKAEKYENKLREITLLGAGAAWKAPQIAQRILDGK